MTIVILSFSDLYKDPRVNRQIRCLKEKHPIIEMGLNPSGYKDTEFIQLNPMKTTLISKMIRSFFSFTHHYRKCEQYTLDLNNYRDVIKYIKKRDDIELIIANDIDSLPLALELKGNSKIIVDAHEYSPEQFDDRILWKLFIKEYIQHLCETYLPKVDAMLTVNESIAEKYEENYGVKPIVITNATEYRPLLPSTVNNNIIKMVYHGTANPSRSIDEIIKIMDYVDDRFALDLILIWGNNNKYQKKIQQMVADRENITIIKPVRRDEIVPFTNQYDIGLCLFKPNNFNLKYTLPNKFFECIQARLAVAIGPSPEMAKYVEKYNLGIITNDFDPKTVAQHLNNLTNEEIEQYKANSHSAAQILSSKYSEKQIVTLAGALISH